MTREVSRKRKNLIASCEEIIISSLALCISDSRSIDVTLQEARASIWKKIEGKESDGKLSDENLIIEHALIGSFLDEVRADFTCLCFESLGLIVRAGDQTESPKNQVLGGEKVLAKKVLISHPVVRHKIIAYIAQLLNTIDLIRLALPSIKDGEYGDNRDSFSSKTYPKSCVPNLSDPHDGHAGTCRVEFYRQPSFYFKPRALTGEEIFFKIWSLMGINVKNEVTIVRVRVDGVECGWMSEVASTKIREALINSPHSKGKGSGLGI